MAFQCPYEREIWVYPRDTLTETSIEPGNLSLSPSAGITFSCDVFQMSINPNYSYGSVTNTLPLQPNRVTHSYGFNSDASVYLPFGLEFNTDLSFSSSSGYSQGYNSDQWLWNAQLSYSFFVRQIADFLSTCLRPSCTEKEYIPIRQRLLNNRQQVQRPHQIRNARPYLEFQYFKKRNLKGLTENPT